MAGKTTVQGRAESASGSPPRTVGRALDLAGGACATTASVVSLILVAGDSPAWTSIVLVIPALLSWGPILLPQHIRQTSRIVAIVCIVCLGLVTMASVGIFFLPAALVLLGAAIASR